MQTIIRSVLTLSILGVSFFSVFLIIGEGGAETESPLTAEKISATEARILNESMYQQPYQSEGITTIAASSLVGTELHNDFRVDANSNLQADASIKDMFDLYLSTLGEYELEQVIATVQGTIKSELSEPARSQALDLLKRYIDYKIGIVDLQQSFVANSNEETMVETLLSQQAEVSSYRKTFFSLEEYEAFFESEDKQNEFLIEQLRINQDPSLTPLEKQQLLSAAEQTLPEDIQMTRKRAQQHALLADKVKLMKENQASQVDIFSAREEALGSEAAVALADLDRQREQWKLRLAQFANERERVMSSSLSDDDKQQSVSQLLAFHFSDTEQKRVSALLGDGRL